MQRGWQNMLAIQSNKELMELFLWSTRDVIKPLGFKISILGYKFVLETTLLFLDLHNVKILNDIAYDIAYDIVSRNIVYDVVYDIVYDIVSGNIVYDVVYDVVCDIQIRCRMRCRMRYRIRHRIRYIEIRCRMRYRMRCYILYCVFFCTLVWWRGFTRPWASRCSRRAASTAACTSSLLR